MFLRDFEFFKNTRQMTLPSCTFCSCDMRNHTVRTTNQNMSATLIFYTISQYAVNVIRGDPTLVYLEATSHHRFPFEPVQPSLRDSNVVVLSKETNVQSITIELLKPSYFW